MKKKVVVIIILLTSIMFLTGITYSFFNSGALFSTSNQEIAKFVFNTEKLDKVSLPLDDLKPSEEKEYLFSVYNNKNGDVSRVTINYQLTIKTLHFIPLEINLYKINNNKEELILTCDETYSRNTDNELVCNSEVQEMKYDVESNDEYKLKLNFIEGYDNEKYSDLVDYIDISIRSWQKIGS